MRRGASRERLFFLLVLVGALLLLSGFMLHHESTALTSRTFRDGFTVAEGVMRRTEVAAATNVKRGSVSKVPDLQTMTVKTEDGDEITIKRAATSKGKKVTTIFRDGKGKLTIKDTTAAEIRRVDTALEAEVVNEAQEGGTQHPLDNILISIPSASFQEDTDRVRHDETTANNDAGEEEVLGSGGNKLILVQATGR